MQVRWRVAAWALVLVCGCDDGAQEAKVHRASPVSVSPEADQGERGPRWIDFTATRKVGAAQSASFDEHGNLWLLDGPRVGVLRADAEAPVWTQLPAQEGRIVLASRICGDVADRAVVAVEPSGSRHLHVTIEADGTPRSLEPHEATSEEVRCDPLRARAERAEAGWRALGASFEDLAGSARVTAYETAGGDVYVGTLDKGLWRRDGDGSVTRVPGLRGRYVRQLHYDPRHETLVVVTERGVFGLLMR